MVATLHRAGALVGLAGAAVFAGCSAPANDGDAAESYADGTYTADGSYATPESVETISVTLTLADGVVTEVAVEGDPQLPESESFQSAFIGGISDEVVGAPIDELSVSRVAGSSLTSGGFNEAIEAIKADAAG
ncbi:hypothetical protein ACFQZV_06880 [Microbacterium koreense]|uniref:FMN-binding domain-containing protein n=1 Tax=Microbacterium koreense TaxID=323761 RepID=A0ABW2ZQU6_9MICO